MFQNGLIKDFEGRTIIATDDDELAFSRPQHQIDQLTSDTSNVSRDPEDYVGANTFVHQKYSNVVKTGTDGTKYDDGISEPPAGTISGIDEYGNPISIKPTEIPNKPKEKLVDGIRRWGCGLFGIGCKNPDVLVDNGWYDYDLTVKAKEDMSKKVNWAVVLPAIVVGTLFVFYLINNNKKGGN